MLPEANGNIIGVAEVGVATDVVAFSLDAYFVTAVNDLSNDVNVVNVIPNPANDYFIVQLPAGNGKVDLFVMDVTGRTGLNILSKKLFQKKFRNWK